MYAKRAKRPAREARDENVPAERADFLSRESAKNLILNKINYQKWFLIKIIAFFFPKSIRKF